MQPLPPGVAVSKAGGLVCAWQGIPSVAQMSAFAYQLISGITQIPRSRDEARRLLGGR
jgi:hypothetical protein